MVFVKVLKNQFDKYLIKLVIPFNKIVKLILKSSGPKVGFFSEIHIKSENVVNSVYLKKFLKKLLIFGKASISSIENIKN